VIAPRRDPILPGAPRRVLLADDDPAVRSGVAEFLSPLGLEFLHAETGPEAVAILRVERARLDLLLLDMHMPGFGGLEVLARLRDDLGPLPQLPPLPTICCSGEATDELMAQALRAGATAFLRKPLQPQALRSEVLRALALHN
jgi:CheY-like chemotaxis protein